MSLNCDSVQLPDDQTLVSRLRHVSNDETFVRHLYPRLIMGLWLRARFESGSENGPLDVASVFDAFNTSILSYEIERNGSAKLAKFMPLWLAAIITDEAALARALELLRVERANLIKHSADHFPTNERPFAT